MSVDKEALFSRALELPPGERAAFLAEACPDPDTRSRVEALLAADDEAPGFLEPPQARFADPLLGQRMGSWRVVARIGEGGMSTVYRAVRDDGAFTMDAAIKVMRPALHTETFLRRFQNEREVLARLRHPNIAQLLDGGVTEDGRPYLVMELVDGIPIQAWCQARRLSIEARLRLMLTVCEAVQMAHRSLVVHRDLKPSNVLVTEDGTVKLLDFGIAKVLETDSSGTDSQVTHTRDRLFTPRYASPEQVLGEPVTTATDVYSLGVMLYQLMTGRPPYDVDDATPAEMERIIRTTVPVRPSAGVGDPVVPESASRVARRLSGDIDNIVLKALRKEPERRYDSVAQFAGDIRRHLDGHPVLARADTVGYRTRRFLKRNRAAAIAGTAGVVILLGATVVSTWLYLRSEASRRTAEGALREARTEREQSDRIASFLSDMLTSANPTETQSREEITVGQVLDRASEQVAVELVDQPRVAAGLYLTLGTTRRQLAQYEEARTDLERSLAIQLELGEISEESIQTRHELGRTLASLGKLDSALVVLREAEGLADSLGSATRADVARARSETLAEAGRMDDAEAAAREAVQIRRGFSDSGTEGMAGDLNQLGLVLTRQGKQGEAEPLLRESLDLLIGAKGDAHSIVAQARNNLAWCLIGLDAFEEAIPLLESAVAVHRTVYAPDHPNLLAARGNLARCYQEAGRFAEAEAIHGEILDALRRTVGDDHPHVGHALNNLAFTLMDEGRFDRAESLFAEAVSVYRRALGDDHPYTAIALSNRARALRSAGRLPEAETVCLASLEIRRKTLREDHPDIAGSAELLGRIRMDRGDLAGAEAVLAEAASILLRARGPDHPAVARCDLLRARVLTDLGRFPEAERLLLHSHAILDTTTDADPKQAEVRDELVRMYRAWDRPKDAERYATLPGTVD